MDKIHYSIYSEQSECTHSYSWKPCKNETVDVSSSAYPLDVEMGKSM